LESLIGFRKKLIVTHCSALPKASKTCGSYDGYIALLGERKLYSFILFLAKNWFHNHIRITLQSSVGESRYSALDVHRKLYSDRVISPYMILVPHVLPTHCFVAISIYSQMQHCRYIAEEHNQQRDLDLS
jgi:hypothetical protein